MLKTFLKNIKFNFKSQNQENLYKVKIKCHKSKKHVL